MRIGTKSLAADTGFLIYQLTLKIKLSISKPMKTFD